MKLPSSTRTPSVSSKKSAAGRRLAASIACLLGLQAFSFAQLDTCPQTTNAASKIPIIIDGRFTREFTQTEQTVIEWSDIVPQGFFVDASGNLFRTCPGDPNTNSYVYSSLAPEGFAGPLESVYLMYDFVSMTTDPNLLSEGQILSTVNFGVNLDGRFGGNATGNSDITVKLIFHFGGIGETTAALRPAAAIPIGGNFFFDVVVDVNTPTGQKNVSGFLIGLQGNASFGASPNSATSHLQFELEVPLRIPAEFGPAFPGGGVNPTTGQYDPAPKFWGSTFDTGTGGGIGLARAAAPAAPIGTVRAASRNLMTIAGDGSVKTNSGVDAGAGFVPFASLSSKKNVLTKLVALRAQITTARNLHELNEAIALVGRSTAPALFADAAHLQKIGGIRVFDLDSEATEELGEIIRSRPALDKAVTDALKLAADALLDADAELAKTALADAIAANKDPLLIALATRLIAAGDKSAANGKAESAFEAYEFAWSALAGSRVRGNRDND